MPESALMLLTYIGCLVDLSLRQEQYRYAIRAEHRRVEASLFRRRSVAVPKQVLISVGEDSKHGRQKMENNLNGFRRKYYLVKSLE